MILHFWTLKRKEKEGGKRERAGEEGRKEGNKGKEGRKEGGKEFGQSLYVSTLSKILIICPL